VFASILALVMPVIAIRSIVGTGLLFGLVFGALVRQCAGSERSERGRGAPRGRSIPVVIAQGEASVCLYGRSAHRAVRSLGD
jgi:hypothetical protein